MTAKREAPEAQARAPGREDRYAIAAGNPLLSSPKASGMNQLQILYLQRLHGLTEAQAQALAALVWGALA
jgi:hypothetical protein